MNKITPMEKRTSILKRDHQRSGLQICSLHLFPRCINKLYNSWSWVHMSRAYEILVVLCFPVLHINSHQPQPSEVDFPSLTGTTLPL
ncbi:hypothetical protein KC19_4G190200 [Ceratodon purpureus]|uniref:Uncharacterized protein n=1 Tax=Ceratodon purpureus TaxID=3225 RepID=A0A8T0ICL9_CERPU|nr:hypothetical protein KC19_4G190200 [Ceratodon purpureus]